MKELEALIAYFITNIPNKIKKTKLFKLIYWFEYYRVQTYGKQLSNANFIRYNYGPYAFEIENTLDDMVGAGLITFEQIITHTGNLSYLYGIGNIDELRKYELEEKDRIIADKTIKDLAYLSHNDLIKKVYSTPPMERILEVEKRTNLTLLKEELNMRKSKPVYKVTKERLLSARRRRLARENRGTYEEYVKCITEEYMMLEPLRRRANICHQ